MPSIVSVLINDCKVNNWLISQQQDINNKLKETLVHVLEILLKFKYFKMLQGVLYVK